MINSCGSLRSLEGVPSPLNGHYEQNAKAMRSKIKGGEHSNHYRMQECTSSRPHPTTHHKPLMIFIQYSTSIRLHANVRILAVF